MASKKANKHRLDEVIGTGLILIALLISVSLFTYHVDDPTFSTVSSTEAIQNAVGKFGAVFADLVVQLIGVGAYLLPLFLIVLGIRNIQEKTPVSLKKSLCWGFLMMATALSSLWSLQPGEASHLPILSMKGGITGQLFSQFLTQFFATVGAYIILYSVFLIGTMLAFPFSPHRVLAACFKQSMKIKNWISTNKLPASIKKKTKKTSGKAEIEMLEAPALPESAALPPPKISKMPPQEFFDFTPEDDGDYHLPSLSLLSDPPVLTGRTTKQELIAQSQVLTRKLLDFGIEGRVTLVHPGPVITMFEFEPAPGIKLSRIVNLSDDLALGMKALSVRIVAPLPGKAAVGIEVPNMNREEVSLKEVLASPSYNRLNSKLRIALGKDIFGKAVSSDLAKMPHLLVAGATGAGKSVGLNGIILSILFSSTPSEVKMLMIDPKMLEFNLYDGIPHLIAPVIVRPKSASRSLQKMVEEMQRRYELLSEKGVRNIAAYNNLAAQSKELTALPYIVVLIDELADLMMVAGRQIEDSIARLAQMARAAGIHLVLATQRPSVDVLTGLIKANFPARIAYRVSSKTDSRTILDANGAEKLLGKGDMLLSAGTGKINRLHGAFVSEEEVKKVVTFIKEQSQPHYEAVFSQELSVEGDRSSEESDERDELYEKARELVISTRQASASFIQRRMRVGYPRAARMIEMMEEDGLVGPAIGSKAREVLLPKREGGYSL